MSSRALLLPLFAAVPLACGTGPLEATGEHSSALTGTSSEQRGIHFQSYVYVPPTATDTDIAAAIAGQVKTAIGALQVPEVSLDALNAENNLDAGAWTRETLTVVDPADAATPATQVVRVTYPYNDLAVVTDTLSKVSSVDFTMLAGSYAPNFSTLLSDCSNDPRETLDSLWYSYTPTMASCQALITNELSAISAERTALGGDATKIGPREAGRWFMPVTAKLDPPQLPSHPYSPEYDRLYGVGTNKSQLLVYAFFGVDSDETNPDDILGQEAIKFLRTMLAAQPNFRVVSTNPFAMLETITVNGQQIPGVTYEQMFSWIVDQTGYPEAVGTDANAILALRKQAMAAFTERWIYWDLPITVTTASGQTTTETVEVSWFYGYEVGSDDIQQRAKWRYLEAFWYGDVFMYNGHSHFGNGPLEPENYGPGNFNSRYQIMLVNSCISYNYYHQDFFAMKPGGTQNLDMVVNGLPAYVLGMGDATGQFLTGLLDGTQKSYEQLLVGMEISEPWQPNYEPMRVADGELDNHFSQAATPLTLHVGAPVYP